MKELQSAGSAGEFYTPRAVTDFMARMIQPKIGETMADFACGTGGFIVSWLKELQKQVQSTADAKKYGDSIYGVEKKQFPYMLCITNLLLHGLDKYRNQLRRMNDPEREKELKEQAKAISAELKPLREDLRMAKRIEEKYPQLQQLLETERDMETRVRTRERERGYER